MENGRLSQFSNCDGAGPLGSSDLDGLYAASLSQDVHGHDARTVERSCRSSPGVACAGDAAGGRASLLRIFSAILCANGGAHFPHLSHREQMMRITAPELEIAVLVVGMAILMVEAFVTKIDKQTLAFAAIAGLAIVFLASFFVAPFPAQNQATGFWSFYSADRLSIFFKQFALVTTIFVVIMMIDYAPVVRSSFPTLQDGLGEFFALPIFTCAGLMYLVSAIDFVFIFVSLEMVTISFYVLVSFTRRNPVTLEAGTKYLVLSALSTAFLVYGIAWIFGVTGQTNLYRLTEALANPDVDRGAALLGMVFVLVALGFKIAAVPFQIWVPDVYQGAPTPGTAYLSVGSKAAGFVVLLRVLQPVLALPPTQRLLVLLAMLIGMVSLAGVPFTAGFLGKFFIFYAAIAQHQTILVIVGVLTVGCGFYYYLKVVRAMYWQSTNLAKIPVNGLSRLAISALVIATIWLGVYPQPILDALKR